MSRDPARILPILDALADYWLQENHRDLRLGQIISNCTPARFGEEIWESDGDSEPIKTVRDPFYMEDDEFLEELRKQP